jgi:hypothetical protein
MRLQVSKRKNKNRYVLYEVCPLEAEAEKLNAKKGK